MAAYQLLPSPKRCGLGVPFNWHTCYQTRSLLHGGELQPCTESVRTKLTSVSVFQMS